MPWSGRNTGSEESTSGGVTDDALAARRRDDQYDDVDGTHAGEHGPGPWPGEGTKGCTRGPDSRTAREAACARRLDEDKRRDETQMFAAGRLDTIYIY